MNETRKQSLKFLKGYLIATVALFGGFATLVVLIGDTGEALTAFLDKAIVGAVVVWVIYSFIALVKIFDFIKGHK